LCLIEAGREGKILSEVTLEQKATGIGPGGTVICKIVTIAEVKERVQGETIVFMADYDQICIEKDVKCRPVTGDRRPAVIFFDVV
jgi:hypothetical protein